MATYVIFSKFPLGSDYSTLRERAAKVHDETHKQLPGSVWSSQYALQGGDYDMIDVVETNDPQGAQKAASIIRKHGLADVRIVPATPWKGFLETL